MVVIVGLGNPGEKYASTRHNLGFNVVDLFLKDFAPVNKDTWSEEKKFKSEVAQIEWNSKKGQVQKVLLVKPQTYMNLSGEAVRAITDYYHIDPSDIWVINDELDLPLGTLKIRQGGASAGHKGVQSIIDHLGQDGFWRFRMGIGISHSPARDDGERVHAIGRTKMHDVEDYVIGEFSTKEATEVKKLIKHTISAIECALEKDLHCAQNQFNTK